MQKTRRNRIALTQTRTAIIAAVGVGWVFCFAQLTDNLIKEHQGTEKTVQNILNGMRAPATTAAYNLSSDFARQSAEITDLLKHTDGEALNIDFASSRHAAPDTPLNLDS